MLCSWVIRPHQDAPARSQDTNGSHIYQLDLKKPKVLPYADYVRPSLLEKRKRKAIDDLGSLSPSKKATTVASHAGSPEWSDLSDDIVMGEWKEWECICTIHFILVVVTSCEINVMCLCLCQYFGSRGMVPLAPLWYMYTCKNTDSDSQIYCS